MDENENRKEKSAITLIIGIICGMLLVGITCVLIFTLGGKKDNKEKSETVTQGEGTSVTQTSAVTTQAVNLKEDFTVENIEIKGNMQYDLNIFMSNFSESDLPNFSEIKKLSYEDMTWFARSYALLNKYSLYEEADRDFDNGMDCNIRIHEKYIKDIVKKYFGLSLDEKKFTENMMYYDGYFYNQVTGGQISEGFTVVNKVEKIGNNKYKVYCDVYYTDGMDNKYYSYTQQQAEKERQKNDIVFVKDKTGTAIIDATDIKDRSTYVLKEYRMQDA